ncbi:MAG TPA: Imm9 family immunity protein [Flavisolibacter sp.]|nr:Imm9 family immunity protein [Flavisolibacter sp.]
MQIRILDSAMITDFINDGFDSKEVCSKIKLETEKLIFSIKEDKLNDWEVCFRFVYNNVKQILIYTKDKSYKVEKYKDITIHIPIPTKEKVFWGVNINQHIYESESHLDHLLKNFLLLDVDYSKFDNRKEYIINCMQRAIKFCFENGFTLNGIFVKI